jgi:hypothetical protein
VALQQNRSAERKRPQCNQRAEGGQEPLQEPAQPDQDGDLPTSSAGRRRVAGRVPHALHGPSGGNTANDRDGKTAPRQFACSTGERVDATPISRVTTAIGAIRLATSRTRTAYPFSSSAQRSSP